MSITGAERPFFALGLAPATPRPPEGALRQLVGDVDWRYETGSVRLGASGVVEVGAVAVVVVRP
jgi:hypothetical protein